MTDAEGAIDRETELTREHLEAALERADDERARYHVRQALQLIEGRTVRSG